MFIFAVERIDKDLKYINNADISASYCMYLILTVSALRCVIPGLICTSNK